MFTLTKLTPPPPVLLINLTICLCFSLPAQAKIIQRKMHMVCQEHETAYWDGSKGVCCDKSIKQVANENRYACCEEWQNAYLYNNAVVCCNEDPNTTPNNLCCTGIGSDGTPEKAFEYAYIDAYNKSKTYYGCCTQIGPSAAHSMEGSIGYKCCSGTAPYHALRNFTEYYTFSTMSYECFSCSDPEAILFDTAASDLGATFYACCPNGYSEWIQDPAGFRYRNCLE